MAASPGNQELEVYVMGELVAHNNKIAGVIPHSDKPRNDGANNPNSLHENACFFQRFQSVVGSPHVGLSDHLHVAHGSFSGPLEELEVYVSMREVQPRLPCTHQQDCRCSST